MDSVFVEVLQMKWVNFKIFPKFNSMSEEAQLGEE